MMKRILVLDDDIDILTLVKTILTMKGYIVETFTNWEQLNGHIENFKPNLVLIDISLSGANGIDLCRELKQTETTKDLPVVLFSANVEMAKKIAECGATDYIAKPFSIKDLLAVIEKSTLETPGTFPDN